MGFEQVRKNKEKQSNQNTSRGGIVSQRLMNSDLMQQKAKEHQAMFGNAIQKQENKTGLPDNLKSGMESLSGMSLDSVRVHYNSSKPASVQAHAFASGSDIHIASGQEKHLPHELGHVVQQAEGRVKPTVNIGGVAVNDSPTLESEATKMGERAMQMKSKVSLNNSNNNLNIKELIQREIDKNISTISKVVEKTSDVFFITYKGGKEIVIKLKGTDEELIGDSVADNALKSINVPAPESELVKASLLLGQIDKIEIANIDKLKQALEKKGEGSVILAEKLQGEALGEDATTPSKSTIGFINDPLFAFDLGKVAAYDAILGHQDRVLGGLNFGNIMTPVQSEDEGENNKGLQQIDNQIAENEIYIKNIIKLDNVFETIIANKESQFAKKIQMTIETVAEREGFKTKEFQAGFVVGLQHFIHKKSYLIEYLENIPKSIQKATLANNIEYLYELTATNKMFYDAYGQAMDMKYEMLRQIKSQKEQEKSKIEKDSKQSKGFFKKLSSLFNK